MKVPVSSDNSVAFMSVVTVGILLGILMVFVMAVSLIVILRRRRYYCHFYRCDVSLLTVTMAVFNDNQGEHTVCSQSIQSLYGH